MDLKTITERARRTLGIDALLPMQQEMSRVSLPARVLLQAPTGSGKTLAFTILMLRALKGNAPGVKALVIAPTRELVLQIYDIIRPIAAPDYKTTVLYGGHSYETEAKSLAGNPDVVIGTPGRLLDHINRHRLDLWKTGVLVIDEYDKALELGFATDMKRITDTMKRVSTLLLTSATSGDIPDFVGAVDHVADYRGEDHGPQESVEVYRIDSPSADKLDTLGALLEALGNRKTMVFVNHREAAERVYDYLQKKSVDSCLYHGGLDQDKRERAMVLFGNGTATVMVSTDLAARGLDIDGVEAVVHYHIPSTPEGWTHRNGRTGRLGGTAGCAYVIVSEKETLPGYAGAETIATKDIEPLSRARRATLFFNAGKKEKISRGDIAGFLIAKGGLQPDEIGRIDVKDHFAYVAVPAAKARDTVTALAPYKIKNTKVRVTQLKNK